MCVPPVTLADLFVRNGQPECTVQSLWSLPESHNAATYLAGRAQQRTKSDDSMGRPTWLVDCCCDLGSWEGAASRNALRQNLDGSADQRLNESPPRMSRLVKQFLVVRRAPLRRACTRSFLGPIPLFSKNSTDTHCRHSILLQTNRKITMTATAAACTSAPSFRP